MKKLTGFTLIEILLVLVIISILIFASVGYMQQRALQMRMDRVTTQMQQILNAGLAYYVANGSWPDDMDDDLKGTYLPNVTLNNPWGNPYSIAAATGTGMFYVYTRINVVSSQGATAAANVIAGSLPLAYTARVAGTPPAMGSPCLPADTSCYVVASVNIPGQNLNNARAVNYAGLYKHGGCVPVPKCPVDANGNTMTPQIMVVPSSVSGVNDAATDPTHVYPISSFTAYATGGTSTSPPACTGGTAVSCAASSDPSGTNYLRACLQVVTEKGTVTSPSSPNSARWGRLVTLMALTRCAVTDEAVGSTFNVYSN